MRPNDFSALDPLGEALIAFWKGDKSAKITQEHRTGRKKTVPASMFFRTTENINPTEDVFSHCKGRILVVGAGTGVHALELERQGYKVTAVDVNPQAVQIMKERGVKDIRCCDFFEFSGEKFETILMLGHNIGICETVEGLNLLLERCKSLLVPDGQLLVNSVDESASSDGKNHEYPGEQEFRLSYEGTFGPWMRWLHIDFETLAKMARECGWAIELLVETKECEYLAKLKPL